MESSTQGPRGLSGAVIGGYRLEDVIGEAAGEIVYRGRRISADSTLPELAAVEVLGLPAGLDLRQERVLLERFQRRMESVRRLGHPRIAPVLAWGEDESQPFVLLRFVVLRYPDGHTLAERLAQGPLPLAEAASLAAQVAEGLDYAYAANVAHGAVTPAHILVDSEGRVYITGFAIDCVPEIWPPALGRAAPPTEAPAITALTMADGDCTAERAGDIRALSGVLYEMVTGRSPFVGGGSTQGGGIRSPGFLAPPRTLRPDLPAPAEAAIMRGLSVESGPPFASAVELATSFAAGLEARREAAPPVSGVLDTAMLEQQPTAPVMAVAPERPTAPLMSIPPRTGQLVWGRHPRPRWFLVAALAVAVLLALALALVAGVGGVRPGTTPTHAPGASTTQGTTGPASSLTPTAIPTQRPMTNQPATIPTLSV